jgi:hypothetical protein
MVLCNATIGDKFSYSLFVNSSTTIYFLFLCLDSPYVEEDILAHFGMSFISAKIPVIVRHKIPFRRTHFKELFFHSLCHLLRISILRW